MALQMIKLDKTGGAVAVDILIGQAQFGRYTVTLFDENGKSPQEVGDGNNVDQLPDSFELPLKAGKLVGRLLGWTVTIGAPDDTSGQAYFCRIAVSQDGKLLDDSPFEYSGPLDGGKIFIGFAKFLA